MQASSNARVKFGPMFWQVVMCGFKIYCMWRVGRPLCDVYKGYKQKWGEHTGWIEQKYK